MNLIEAARKTLKEKLSKCNKDEIEFFNRMYVSVDEIPFEKMVWAEKQIDRTLEKHKEIEKNV